MFVCLYVCLSSQQPSVWVCSCPPPLAHPEPRLLLTEPGCEFFLLQRPPTYFKAWVGKEEFLTLIGSVSEVFGPSFTYHRQFVSPDGSDWALEFSADIRDSGRRVNGIDLVQVRRARNAGVI